MIKLLVIHGPNLNMLGSREPEVYGSDTLASINASMAQMAKSSKVNLETFQSNLEGEIVDRIQQAVAEQTQFIIINPAAFTHTSVAIRDAFLASNIPFIEVHLSNVHAREDFRKHSYLSDIASGVISGFGKDSYLLAFEAAVNQCNQSNS
jgi:3-dehydroquinate dehydratase-2